MNWKKIMFVMLKTLGDVVLGTTIVHELKRQNPGSEIHFYTNPSYAPLLANNPEIHSVHASDDWNNDMLFIEMASQDYDLIYAPYQTRPECNMWHQDDETRHQHLVDFYWSRMGMHRVITERECYIYPSAEDFAAAEKLISFDVPRIAVHSTTGVATKDWPYFDLLVEACRKAGYGCIQVGAPKDKKINGAVDLRGKMSLIELAAFLSKCACFVGLDSGISYISDAMKTPTIVIQGSTNPVTSGPISNRVVHLFAEDTGYDDCRKIRCHSNCRHEINCISRVSVDRALSAIDDAVRAWNSPIPTGV